MQDMQVACGRREAFQVARMAYAKHVRQEEDRLTTDECVLSCLSSKCWKSVRFCGPESGKGDAVVLFKSQQCSRITNAMGQSPDLRSLK
jgi:hypothetical protein